MRGCRNDISLWVHRLGTPQRAKAQVSREKLTWQLSGASGSELSLVASGDLTVPVRDAASPSWGVSEGEESSRIRGLCSRVCRTAAETWEDRC